ncbi:helix-turn-helix domain-containing protein (plasmid) [Apilactobacillus apisilvae]|uniref:Helix-turn-helix domain-containing protein n=1 Tax=Apilactobacillus apisilvae TaxID=2923364 RepID=A0ABY4PJR1_9LACO|nr:helix-turn-helix transcriptional regulator [Apilactobacillus apisilvae]UQS85838.1 helix-turn-helix domain-containing protein [Apilactobacillus apisilvae]
MDVKNILGPIIRKIRLEHHLTQSDLSKRTGYKQNTISQHESQKRELSETDLINYAKAFDVKPQYFYDRLNFSKEEISKIISKNKEEKNIEKKINSLVKKLNNKDKLEVLQFIAFKLDNREN